MTKEAIGVLIRSALPGTVRMSGVDLETQSISSGGRHVGPLCKRACRKRIQRPRKTSKNFLQKLFFRVSCFLRCFWATSITCDAAMSSGVETVERSAPISILVKNSPYI